MGKKDDWKAPWWMGMRTLERGNWDWLGTMSGDRMRETVNGWTGRWRATGRRLNDWGGWRRRLEQELAGNFSTIYFFRLENDSLLKLQLIVRKYQFQ